MKIFRNDLKLNLRRLLIAAGMLLAIAAVWTAGNIWAGVLIVNCSDSVPGRLFKVKEVITPDTAIRKGDYVSVCFSKNSKAVKIEEEVYDGEKIFGSCPTGRKPFLKFIAGTPGDLIMADGRHAVKINSEVLKWSHPIRTKYKTLIPEEINRRLAENEFWVYGNMQQSIDSRYFGPVDRSELISVMERIW